MNKHRTMIELIDKEDAISACNAQVWEGEALADIKNCIKPVLTIPENPTNGDMIKAMFPNIESRLDEKAGIILVKWTDGATKTFKASWWNAPYKQEEQNG